MLRPFFWFGQPHALKHASVSDFVPFFMVWAAYGDVRDIMSSFTTVRCTMHRIMELCARYVFSCGMKRWLPYI